MSAADHKVLFYSPLFIAQSSVLMGLFALLTMAAMAGDAATRDVETRMEPLMHAAPIGRLTYLGGRFAAAFILIALVLLAVPLALILARVFLGAAATGPIRAAAFLQTYFLLLLPNAFVASAFMFALATKVRHTVGKLRGGRTRVSGVVAQHAGDRPIDGALGVGETRSIPPASRRSRVMADTWSPADLNARLVGLGGGLLWNRLLWLALACGALVFTYAKFRYGINGRTTRWWQRRARARRSRRCPRSRTAQRSRCPTHRGHSAPPAAFTRRWRLRAIRSWSWRRRGRCS